MAVYCILGDEHRKNGKNVEMSGAGLLNSFFLVT